jgi:DNA polymerase kappa
LKSTSNYHARKFGVRAAMPGFIGKKLCPDLVIVPLNFEKYTSMSKLVKAIIAEYDPNFCPMSLDEAYLDITDHLVKRLSMPEQERTLICRDSSYVDSKIHCHCDLNEIQRKYENDGFSLVRIHELIKKGGNSEKFSENPEDLKPRATEADCGDVGREVTLNCPECKKQLPPFDFKTFGVSDEEAVNEMRCRVEQKTRLTASAGKSDLHIHVLRSKK